MMIFPLYDSIILLKLEPIDGVVIKNKVWEKAGRQASVVLMAKQVSWVTTAPEQNQLKSQGTYLSDILIKEFSISS